MILNFHYEPFYLSFSAFTFRLFSVSVPMHAKGEACLLVFLYKRLLGIAPAEKQINNVLYYEKLLDFFLVKKVLEICTFFLVKLEICTEPVNELGWVIGFHVWRAGPFHSIMC